MDKLFELYLQRSDFFRKGYYKSLLPINSQWMSILNRLMKDIPELLKTIYSKVSGTKYDTKNQVYMDFIPGYLLIHVDEYMVKYTELKSILIERNEQGEFYPLLTNYSSDFIALKKEDNGIYQIMHDDLEIELLYQNPFDFLQTLNANYERQVYFLDEDGFLDYDADLEYEVAKEFNSNVEFWQEND